MSTAQLDSIAPDATPVCSVAGLGISLVTTGTPVVDGVDVQLAAGEIVGLVGESGSGKTTTGTALLGYARSGAAISAGTIRVADFEVRSMTPGQVRNMRGVTIGYVPQDPSSALNPAHRILGQLRETLDLHNIGPADERLGRIREILEQVGLPSDDEFLRRYPHQLSGGQVQRVALAMMFLPRPQVLVLDEPTTGLDVTTQAMVLTTLADLCKSYDVAALYVTHDLAVVAQIANRAAVMYAGQIVEQGRTSDLFATPAHPYTRALLRAIPHLHEPLLLSGIPGSTPAPGRRPSGCRFHDRCSFAIDACATTTPSLIPVPNSPGHGLSGDEQHVARCIRLTELPPWDITDRIVADTAPDAARDIVLNVSDLNVFYGRSHVVHDVSFDLAKREVVALVGESGSGKTTISRCVGGIHREWTGVINLQEENLAPNARRRTPAQRQKVQYIFQNPYLSLNPRRTVEQILLRPFELFGIAKGADARDHAAQLLDAVQLSRDTLRLRTGALSGGERQRVAIARALAAEPEVLVCDEITSALDVSIQGSITELLTQIKNERNLSMLFVTHNLALVRSVADRVLVLNQGRVVESGLTAQVLDHPHADYTQSLIANTPEV